MDNALKAEKEELSHLERETSHAAMHVAKLDTELSLANGEHLKKSTKLGELDDSYKLDFGTKPLPELIADKDKEIDDLKSAIALYQSKDIVYQEFLAEAEECKKCPLCDKQFADKTAAGRAFIKKVLSTEYSTLLIWLSSRMTC